MLKNAGSDQEAVGQLIYSNKAIKRHVEANKSHNEASRMFFSLNSNAKWASKLSRDGLIESQSARIDARASVHFAEGPVGVYVRVDWVA